MNIHRWVPFLALAAILGSAFWFLADFGAYVEIYGERICKFDTRYDLGYVESSIVGLGLAALTWGLIELPRLARRKR